MCDSFDEDNERYYTFALRTHCPTPLTAANSKVENGATIVIPGSHLWGPDRCPYDEEAIPAELEPGSALIFVGNTYHAGGGNTTADQARETVGIFLCKGYYRQAENQYLMVPPDKAKRLSPQAQRLLGYGISLPAVGFMEYQDPMVRIILLKDNRSLTRVLPESFIWC